MLRVLTYNIQFCRGTDRVIDVDRIAAAIAPFGADVIGLQEVDILRVRSGVLDQAHRIADRLGMQYLFGPTIERGTERYGIATLSRLPIREHRLLPLPARTPQHEPRVVLITHLDWAGRTLVHANTHLSVRWGERQRQIEALVAGLGPAGPDAAPTIACGDLNCTPWSRPFRTFARRLTPVASPPSWPSPLPFVPLDHILVSGLRAVRSGVWRDGPATRRASDHLPVFAELVPA